MTTGTPDATLSKQETSGPSRQVPPDTTLRETPTKDRPQLAPALVSALPGDQRCILCGLGTSTSIRLVHCKTCGNQYHAHCANLSLPPEDGNLFCRHACYARHAQTQEATDAVYRTGDYPLLATQIQRVLQERSDRLHVRQDGVGSTERGRGKGQGRGRGRGRARATGIKRPLQEDNAVARLSARTGRRESGSTAEPRDVTFNPLPTATWSVDKDHVRAHGSLRPCTPSQFKPEEQSLQSLARLASPAPCRPRIGVETEQTSHSRPALPWTRPLSSTVHLTRQARIASPASDLCRASIIRPHHELLSPQYSMASSLRAQEDARSHQTRHEGYDRRAVGHERLTHANHSMVPSRQSLQQKRQDEWPRLQRGFEPPYRSESAPLARSSSPYNGASGPRTDVVQTLKSAPALKYELHPPSHRSCGRHVPNIPWRNPSSFPAEIYERFRCHLEDANHVFRIDLSPVFTEKAMKLYQGEIDFFFRCFESPDVSLVVNGMGSELNPYIWAWPFILECCGNDTHFAFDHFVYKQPSTMDLPELTYVGKLQLSMASYNSYLEKYLSKAPGKDVVVLEDHVTKQTITIVASENIIVLNDLALAKYCAQLYNDLIKGFQWDVFAGGIHCLLQYLPQSSWHDRFSSPRLHFNFPGARGALGDPGNGTTDTAYQVLVGSLELVIFERFEPMVKVEFDLVLHRSGYDAARKTMLLDAHLCALRSAGFAFSTVVLQDGEFVHVNKGRQHFWHVIEKASTNRSLNAPCVFLSWEWVYQGVSQRGISTECWFAMKNASMCADGWVFDPRRAIVEAAKCGVAIVRTGQFLRSALALGRPPTSQLLSFTASPPPIDRSVVAQRQAQMILFLESILPCLDAIVDEAYELGLSSPDDSEEFRKVFDDEGMWRTVDADLRDPPADTTENYLCGICEREITNLYKQCLGCTVYSRRCRPNMAYSIFRICLRCFSQPEQHHYKPRAIASYYEKILSSEGHTGMLPSTRRYQSVRSYFKCQCVPSLRCAHCGGCESCSCVCHTLFQTRFRFTAPANLERLRVDVDAVVKFHQQQLLQLPPQHQR